MQVLPVYEMSFKMVFLIFIIFSFVGWLSEVLYVGIFFEHRFVNRGFLHGPICPIYGLGGLTILLLPEPLYSTCTPLFCASMVLCTVVEYISSWILEKLFHTRWWDYSRYKINIHGRVCLLNSLLFGVLGVAIIHFIQPHVMRFLSFFSSFVLNITADVLAIALVVDLLITVRRLVDFSVSMAKLASIRENLRERFDRKDEFNAALRKKLEALQPRLKNIESFIHRFPTLKNINYREELMILKERFLKRKNKK